MKRVVIGLAVLALIGMGCIAAIRLQHHRERVDTLRHEASVKAERLQTLEGALTPLQPDGQALEEAMRKFSTITGRSDDAIGMVGLMVDQLQAADSVRAKLVEDFTRLRRVVPRMPDADFASAYNEVGNEGQAFHDDIIEIRSDLSAIQSNLFAAAVMTGGVSKSSTRFWKDFAALDRDSSELGATLEHVREEYADEARDSQSNFRSAADASLWVSLQSP